MKNKVSAAVAVVAAAAPTTTTTTQHAAAAAAVAALPITTTTTTQHAAAAAAVAAATTTPNTANMQYIMAQNRELYQQNVEIISTIKKQHDFMKIELQQMKHIMMQRCVVDGTTSTSSFAAQIQQQQEQQEEEQILAAAAADDDDDNSHHSNNTIIDYTTIPYESTLSNHPKDLYQLWREYQYGLDGRKAAKLFNTRERGRVKYKYHRRKVFWDKVKEMKTYHGYNTSRAAIEELYRLYGGKNNNNVTKIINQMRIDRQKNPPLPPPAAVVQPQTTVADSVGPQIRLPLTPHQRRQLVRAKDDDNDSYRSDDTTSVIDDGAIPFELTLSKQPKDLYQLWEEYEYGIGGRKPAKRFNTKERGKVRYKYHRRKVVWDAIKQMSKYEGQTYNSAIEEIYRIYGNDEDGKKLPVTAIINEMRKDRRATKKISKRTRI